jgi:predicted permease
MTRPDGVRRLFRLGPTARGSATEVDDELRFHLESRVAELIAGGLPRADAERAAAREFGDLRAARAELTAIDRRHLVRAGRAEWWRGWTRDVHYALRALRRAPAFTAAALLTIAIGVGANGAIFSVTDAALLRPLPYRDPDALVDIWGTSPTSSIGKSDVSYPNFLDWQRRSTAFAGLAAYNANAMVLQHGDAPRVLLVGKTSANFFDVLSVPPARGHFFAEGQDAIGAARVVILTHGTWTREFGGDPAIVGRAVTLDGAPYTVVGVLPAEFRFASVGAAELFVPLDRPTSVRADRGASWLNIVGRLAPGVTLDRARRDLAAVARTLAREYPATNAGVGTLVVPLRDAETGAVRPLLLLLSGAAGLVLLVALANVANLLLVRGTARQREFALRAALGAGRGRLLRQLLTENVLLAALGGALGGGGAPFGVRALLAAIPPERRALMPYLADVGVDGRVLAYMLAASLLAGVVFGTVPALRVVRPRLYDTLRQGARGSSDGAGGRLRDALVAAELAVSVVLVTGTALLGKSLVRVLSVDPGFRAERVYTASVPLPRAGYPSPAARLEFFTRLEERVRALPGVASVGLTTKLPLDFGNAAPYRVVGRPAPEPGRAPTASVRTVTPDYFRTLGIRLLRGGGFDARRDSAAPRAVVVNETLAHRTFDREDPIGRLVLAGDDAVPWTIVGVVGDVAIGKLEDETPPTIYFPFARRPEAVMRLAARTRGDGAGFAASLRRVVRELDPQVALAQERPMESLVAESPSVFVRRFPLLLIGAFAVTTLVLAVVGTYGVISYAVAQRSRELGIRLALGAAPRSVVTLVAGRGIALAAVGIGVGLVGAAALSRLAESFLFGVRAGDPSSYGVAAAVLATAAALAAAIPARRAARVDPALILRND